ECLECWRRAFLEVNPSLLPGKAPPVSVGMVFHPADRLGAAVVRRGVGCWLPAERRPASTQFDQAATPSSGPYRLPAAAPSAVRRLATNPVVLRPVERVLTRHRTEHLALPGDAWNRLPVE